MLVVSAIDLCNSCSQIIELAASMYVFSDLATHIGISFCFSHLRYCRNDTPSPKHIVESAVPILVFCFQLLCDCLSFSSCSATMRNDTVDIDPLLTIPLYLHDHPSEMYRKVALCYEVRGHADTIYNLISDKCVSVNGYYKEMAARTRLNVLGAVGVVAIDNKGECVTIAVEQVHGTCIAKVNGEMLFSSFKKNGVVVDVTHDQVRLSVPNCEMVDLAIWVMCQETAGYDTIKFVVTRGVNMWPTSHGLLGGYCNTTIHTL